MPARRGRRTDAEILLEERVVRVLEPDAHIGKGAHAMFPIVGAEARA